jgi:sulfoxide reductase catalytic subunit YedY
MLIRRIDSSQPQGSEIASETVYRQRRRLLQAAGVLGAGALLPRSLLAAQAPLYTPEADRANVPAFLHQKILARHLNPNGTGEALTPYKDVTQYNNFYEFGLDKADPYQNSQKFRAEPWSVRVDGECAKPGTYTLEDILKPHALEDRIYRHRCVEAWSIVVPWLGFPLADLIKRFQPTAKARYVEFTTLKDPKQFPEQDGHALNWPYVEGLRMDEALHPLALLTVGLYGRSLPPQNGAPLRLVVPWKYGFKSIKSIVRIRFSETQPNTTWAMTGPNEYGFYANVNPAVDHPRWSQRQERRLPGTLFGSNWIDTRPFNGYASEVAGLYKGMDLRRYF